MLARINEDNDNNDDSPHFERRVNEITATLEPFIREHLLKKVSRINATIIVEYIQAIHV